MKDCIPCKRAFTAAGEECDEEGATEMKCYEVTTTPIPYSSVPLMREEVEESAANLLVEGWWVLYCFVFVLVCNFLTILFCY